MRYLIKIVCFFFHSVMHLEVPLNDRVKCTQKDKSLYYKQSFALCVVTLFANFNEFFMQNYIQKSPLNKDMKGRKIKG